MRIYTRGENQSLLINREITVTVLDIFPDHVRIGIAAPRNEPSYWEADLYLPDEADAEAIELELSIN